MLARVLLLSTPTSTPAPKATPLESKVTASAPAMLTMRVWSNASTVTSCPGWALPLWLTSALRPMLASVSSVKTLTTSEPATAEPPVDAPPPAAIDITSIADGSSGMSPSGIASGFSVVRARTVVSPAALMTALSPTVA